MGYRLPFCILQLIQEVYVYYGQYASEIGFFHIRIFVFCNGLFFKWLKKLKLFLNVKAKKLSIFLLTITKIILIISYIII